jgi:hypothetical protein
MQKQDCNPREEKRERMMREHLSEHTASVCEGGTSNSLRAIEKARRRRA